MSTTEDVICSAIRKVKPSLTETGLTSDTRFDQFNISSMEMAMIVFEINDHYDMEIEPYTLMTFSTIGDACRHIDQLLTERQHPELVRVSDV